MARSAPAVEGEAPQQTRDAKDASDSRATAAGDGRTSTARTVGRLLIVGLVMAALGYGGGRLHAWSHAQAVQQEHAAELLAQRESELRAKEAQQQVLTHAQALTERAQRERDQLALVTGVYEGYRRVQHALNALDARNFGIAEARVRDAERQLAPLAEQVSGLPEIVARLAATNVAVAGNLADQRRSLAAIVSSLDEMVSEQRTAANIEELQAATRNEAAPEGAGTESAAVAGAPRPAAAEGDEADVERTAPEPLVPAPAAAPADAPEPAQQDVPSR